MTLPDEGARRRILQKHLHGIPAELSSCDAARVLSVTEGFTGADLKRLVEDAKGLYAFNRSTGAGARAATEYFVEAANGVRENKRRYEQAELAARARPRAASPAYYYAAPGTEDD